MKVGEAKLSLLGKARARPDQLRKVVDTAAQLGPAEAYKRAINKLDSYTPLGYSLSGIVEAVGAGAEEFSVGQLVACAGNDHALHAEVNWVPVNLCVPVARRRGAATRRVRDRWRDRDARRATRRGAARRDRLCDRPGPRRPAGRAAVVARRACGWSASTSSTNGAGPRRRPARPRARVPTPTASRASRRRCGARPAARRRSRLHRRRRQRRTIRLNIAARIARDRARVVDIGKTPPRSPVERVLRQGARRPVLALVRAGPLRRPLRARGHRLSGGLRPLDRTPQPRVLRRSRSNTKRCRSTCSCRGTFPVDDATDVYARIADHSLTGSDSCSSTAGSDRTAARTRRQPPIDRAPPDAARTGEPAAARRIHRRRQLRDVDAAAASAWRRTGRADEGRDRASLSAVNAQRQVRLPHAATGERDRSRRRRYRRRLHRDTSSLACRPGVPRARTREGRVRREAARARRRTNSIACSTSCARVATTGSWSVSTGVSRRCSRP